MDIKLKAILGESARQLVRTERGGQGGNYTFPKLGLTAISIDQGQISSTVQWCIHGTEALISGDIEDHIVAFELTVLGVESCAHGHYVLRNRSQQILAEARVENWVSEKAQLYILGKRREDVVKLFEQIRDGETAPESAGGRRGLIRDLKGEISVRERDFATLSTAYEDANRDLLAEQRQVSALEGENSRLNALVTGLQMENAELKKPKGFWQVFLANFHRSYDAQVA